MSKILPLPPVWSWVMPRRCRRATLLASIVWSKPFSPRTFLCVFLPTGESRPRLTTFGRVLPSARLIRTTLFPERNVPDIRFTLAVMQWAQIVAHDVTLLTEKSGKPKRKIANKIINNNKSVLYVLELSAQDTLCSDRAWCYVLCAGSRRFVFCFLSDDKYRIIAIFSTSYYS